MSSVYDTVNTVIGAKRESFRQLVTRAEGGGGIGAGAIAGIIAVVVVITALLLFLFVRNRNRRQAPFNTYPSQKSIFALGPTKPQPQYLPTYVQPSSAYAQHHHGGVTMPQAVHPNAGGYYSHAGQGQYDDRVRFGEVRVATF